MAVRSPCPQGSHGSCSRSSSACRRCPLHGCTRGGTLGGGHAGNGHDAIQGHVAHLRRLLGREAIVTRPPGYLLSFKEQDTLDLARFDRLFGEGRDALSRGQAREAARSWQRHSPSFEARRWPISAMRPSRRRRAPAWRSFAWLAWRSGSRPTSPLPATASLWASWRRCSPSTRCASVCTLSACSSAPPAGGGALRIPGGPPRAPRGLGIEPGEELQALTAPF